MEKQELKSKWDELARELGAEIPPETLEREQARSTSAADIGEPAASDVPPRPATVSPPSPKRSAADWDKLAGDLGLPPVEPAARPQEAPIEERQTASPPEAVSRKPALDRPPGAPRQRPQPREPRESREPRERREKRSESYGKQRQSSGKQREPHRRSDETTPFERDTVVEPQVPAPPAEPREEPAKPAAVSLWHKIFGSPAEQSAKLTDIPSTTSEPSESFESPEEAVGISSDEIRSLSGADVTAAAFVEERDRGEESALTEESAQTERKRGQLRRRRRGGRGRKSERSGEGRRRATPDVESSRDALTVGDDFDDLGVADSMDEDADSDSLADQLAADENSDGEHMDATDSDRSKAAQRTIPSWEEAIGFIVDSNMQSRSQRRPPSRSPSRGNSSRGRSRGRRKN